MNKNNIKEKIKEVIKEEKEKRRKEISDDIFMSALIVLSMINIGIMVWTASIYSTTVEDSIHKNYLILLIILPFLNQFAIIWATTREE